VGDITLPFSDTTVPLASAVGFSTTQPVDGPGLASHFEALKAEMKTMIAENQKQQLEVLERIHTGFASPRQGYEPLNVSPEEGAEETTEARLRAEIDRLKLREASLMVELAKAKAGEAECKSREAASTSFFQSALSEFCCGKPQGVVQRGLPSFPPPESRECDG